MIEDVRLASLADEMQIYNLCSLMHAEQPYHPLSWPKVTSMIRLALRRDGEARGIVGVIGEPHDLHAAIFLLIDPIWYSEDWHLLEFFNYVRPDHRRSTYAHDLINYAKQCADSLGLDLTLGVFSNIRTEAKCRLYRRMLPKMGEFFCYRPEGVLETHRLLEQEAANTIAAE